MEVGETTEGDIERGNGVRVKVRKLKKKGKKEREIKREKKYGKYNTNTKVRLPGFVLLHLSDGVGR